MENQKEEIKSKFSKNLFWDINIRDLDMEKYPAYVIERVLDRGTLEDWILICRYYGLEKIKNVALDLRYMFPKSLSFIATVTRTPETEFRCYKNLQSIGQPWGY